MSEQFRYPSPNGQVRWCVAARAPLRAPFTSLSRRLSIFSLLLPYFSFSHFSFSHAFQFTNDYSVTPAPKVAKAAKAAKPAASQEINGETLELALAVVKALDENPGHTILLVPAEFVAALEQEASKGTTKAAAKAPKAAKKAAPKKAVAPKKAAASKKARL